MPKPEPSATSSLTAGEAVGKIAGLITETDESRPDAPATEPAPTPGAPAETPPAPTPSEPAATEPPPSEDSAQTYEVTVDGETHQVDLDELRAGYQKHEDYKRKTMALAEERRTFEAESQAVQAERTQYADGLKQLVSAIEQLQGEPDWDALHAKVDPAEFLRQKAEWERTKAHTERLKAEQRRVEQEAQADEMKRYHAYVRAEQDKLKTALPDWADPDKAKVESAQLRAHAKSYGFTDKELDQVVDSRTILLLRDALKYKQLQREPSAQAKAKSPAIRTAKPGATPPPPPANARQQELIQQAAKTHRLRDASKAIEALLE